MLQLYGFIAVPDGPLMMTTALFLLTFKWFSENRRCAWLWMGVAMALMAYSKYHGALVVLFALAATPPSVPASDPISQRRGSAVAARAAFRVAVRARLGLAGLSSGGA